MKFLLPSLAMVLIAAGTVVILKPEPRPATGLHYSLNGTTEIFDAAYKNIQVEKPEERISGITVNHHLLAADLVAEQFSLVATDKPITVVLISPNHFFLGEGRVISSRHDWQTPYGVLKTDQRLVDKLENTGLVNIDETPFKQEHGVSGLAGFVKKSIPNAKFAAIVVKDLATDEQIDQLAAELNQALPADSLIVGSFDFSHYVTSAAADFHDAQSLAVMNNFDYDRINSLDIDSHAGLRLMLKYLDLRGDKKFVLNSHSNTSKVTGNYSFTEITSYINGYFTEGSNPRNDNQTVLYFGKLNEGLGFEKTDRLFKYNDAVITAPDKSFEFLSLAGQAIAVGLIKNQDKVTDIYLFPLKIVDKQVLLLPFDESSKILADIARLSGASEEIKDQIKTGHIVIK